MLKLINVNRINYDGRHNAFTDLVEWKNKYYLVFRSGERHIAPPHGKIVLLVSEDLANWEEAAIFDTRGDNRDAKLLATPDKLIVYFLQCADRVCRMQAVYTTDGLSWSDPVPCYDPGYVVWKPKKAPDGTYYVAADSLYVCFNMSAGAKPHFAPAETMEYPVLSPCEFKKFRFSIIANLSCGIPP